MNTKYTNLLNIVLGLFLIFYAANQFLHILPTSYGDMPEFTQSYLDATAPFLPALYVFEIIIGLMLVINRWRPFILLVLAPLTINFLIFNITNLILDYSTNALTENLGRIWPAALVAILNIILIFHYQDRYKPLFK